MMRSVLAIVFALAILVAAPAAAQRPTQIPVAVGGATPGVNIQFFMDANKLADTTASSTGGLTWVLDLGNIPKTKLTVYVDVCKDGKIVKVMFVSGSGQPPPEDDDCNRRLAALSFQSDCAGVHINLNFADLGASNVIGCGGMPRNRMVMIGGAVVGGSLIAIAGAGGGNSTTTANTTSPPVTASATTTTAAAPTTPPVTANGSYQCVACSIRVDVSNHNGTLRVCDGLVAIFTVVEGLLTIRHQSPFIDVTGSNYNTTTGAFDVSGTGSVAGFNNVSARAIGTVNLQTGTITFDYTLGSNGVFPGGQPITYSIVIQKR